MKADVRDLLTELSQLNIRLEVEDENLGISLPFEVELAPGLLEKIRTYKGELIRYCRESEGSFSGIPVVRGEGPYALSPAQRRLWILSRSMAASVAYNMPGIYRFKGDLHPGVMGRAFETIVRRHESLRTVFRTDGEGEAFQQVLSYGELGFELVAEDLSKADDSEARLKDEIRQQLLKPFDLSSGPLLRATFYWMGDDEYVFVFVIHHIISDAWSIEVFIQELLMLYNAFRKGGDDPLKPPRIQYKDYAAWHLDMLRGEKIRAEREYWMSQFAGEVPVFTVPGQKSRPGTKTYNGDRVVHVFSAEAANELFSLARTWGGTGFMGLLSCVYALLFRYSGQSDIVVGTSVAGRDHPDLNDQMGFFVNTLALRTSVHAADRFDTLFDRVRGVALGAFSNQLFPFDQLVEELKIGHTRSHSPLFNIMVVLQNAGSATSGRQQAGMQGLTVTEFPGEGFTSKFDLIFNFYESDDRLKLSLEYNIDIYGREFAEQLCRHLDNLIEGWTKNTDHLLGEIDILGPEERDRQLYDLNGPFISYPAGSSVVDYFEEQVALRPEAVAVVFEDRRWTYQELGHHSTRFGNYLLSVHGVKNEEPVGILFPRNEWAIAVILGIVKAGGVYVPIDPGYPAEIIAHIIEDSGCRVVIDEGELERFSRWVSSDPITTLPGCRGPESLAYIIYTSGTTGKPKGVEVDHRGIIRLVRSPNYIDLDHTRILLVTGAPSFDSTTFEYWGMLLNGGTLVLADKEDLLIGEQMEELIRRHHVNTMWLTSSWFNEIIGNNVGMFSGMRTLLIGGDRLSVAHVNMLVNACAGITIINGYGPTENTTFSLCHKVEAPCEDEIPIGRPIRNSTVYILDSQGSLLPWGAIGEIFVGGDGLARGYHRLPELTREKFVNHPFEAGTRLYRTGDLGKWLPDATVGFEGRLDDQFKVRGYRIEPGEIENVLVSSGLVEQAYVSPCEIKGERQIVAYLSGGEGMDIPAVRAYLKSRLPAYMIPTYFIPMAALPLTVNGKIDRRALPAPGDAGVNAGPEYVAPGDAMEEKVVALWSRILHLEKIGIYDDFFELGGHSLRLARLISLYEKELQVHLLLESLFENTTVSAHVRMIRKASFTLLARIDKAREQEYYHLSSAQKRLYFLHDFAPLSTTYNIPMVMYLGRVVDRERLDGALSQLAGRHEGLRTSFEKIDGQVFQKVHAMVPVRMDEHECGHDDLKDHIHSYIRPFDLSQAPLIRCCLVNVRQMGYVWIVDVHHIVSDGTSHEILIEDFLRFYNGERVAALPLQYKDFSEWQNRNIETGSIQAQKEYWARQLSGPLPRVNLPRSHPRPSTFTFEGAVFSIDIEKHLCQKLAAFNTQRKSTMQMTFLSILHVLFYRYSGQEDIITGCTIAGRRHPDLERVAGIFVNSLPIRSFPEGDKPFDVFHREIVQTCLEAYENQDMQFEDLVDMLQLERDPSRNPVYDVALVVQNYERSGANAAGLLDTDAPPEIREALSFTGTTSKFDMTWFVLDRGEGIRIVVEYYRAIYEEEDIRRMTEHFTNILSIVLSGPQVLLSEINLLSSFEKKIILDEYSPGEKVEYPSGDTLHGLFEHRVAECRERVAIVEDGGGYSYAELEEQANRLSRFLYEELGLAAESRVGIMQVRNPRLIVSMLAVLKAGGVYVPLDGDYPEERLLYMLEDANIEILLTDKLLIETANRLFWRSNGIKHLVCVDSEDIDREAGQPMNGLMKKELWDHVGETAGDEISGGGWQSSYTGDLFSEEEMAEYAANISAKTLPYVKKGSKVLEIGCSSGITMFSIAEKTGHYCGTDLSDRILDRTRQSAMDKGVSNISLHCLPAHEIDRLQEGDFDMVILNSVIHCFNGHNYLRDVLVKAISKMKPTGILFLGDLMDEERRAALIEDTRRFKESHKDRSYPTKTDWSAELFLSKEYLNHLVDEGIGISSVEYSGKLGMLQNELTRFRFDALLRVDKVAPAPRVERRKWRHDLRAIDNFSSQPLGLTMESSRLAYIIYTSGSSGRPKGVMVEHRSVINYIYYVLRTYRSNSHPESFGLFTSISFDLTVTSIFAPLLDGGFVRMYNPSLEIAELLKQYSTEEGGVENIKLTPSHISLLASLEISRFVPRIAIVGGSELHPAQIHFLKGLNSELRVFNEYGPTEATVGCIVWEVNQGSGRILIGRPIANSEVYILDKWGKLVPEGIIGEIFIAGAGLARGYLNMGDATREKFVTHPFKEGARMYRSGDLGRWTNGGEIEYLGRIDEQIKVRGFRIEAGEIEGIISGLSQVRGALVVARNGEDGETELIAYFVSHEDMDVRTIREHLKERLPGYMVPAYFIRVDTFPLTPNGKINKRALPAPEQPERNGEYVAPGSELEHRLATIWRKILNVDRVGVRDNFFAMGGHSLKAIKLTALYEKELSRKISLRSVFENPTISQQAQLLVQEAYRGFRRIEKAAKKPYYALSPAQRRLYFLNELAPDSTSYNMPVVEYLGKNFEAAKIKIALQSLVDRHEGLRTSFVNIDGTAYQRIEEKSVLAIEEFDCALDEFRDFLESYIRPFDLAKAPLMRAAIVRLGDGGLVLVIDEHHIISDGVSHQLLIEEFLQVYEGTVLPAPRLQYVDYSEWQNHLAETGEFDRQMRYWKERFADGVPELQLRGDGPRPASFTFEGDRLGFTIGKEPVVALKALGKRFEGTLQMTLLATLNALLHKYTGQEDIVVGCGIAGRNHADTDKIYGMFVNSLAIRSFPAGKKPFSKFYEEVRSGCLSAYENQDVQFNDLVDVLQSERDPGRNPLFDVLLVVQNFEWADTTRVREAIRSENGGKLPDGDQLQFVNRTAKFDLTFHVWELAEELYISIEYYTPVYHKSFIQRLIGHFKQAMASVTDDPDVLIDEISILSAGEKQHIMNDLSGGPERSFPVDETIHRVFARQYANFPQRVAVTDAAISLTYADLEKRSNQLANFLLGEIALAPESRLGLLQDKNSGLIVSVLGVLKAGGAYLPLDTGFPEERLIFMLEDSAVTTLIVDRNLVDLANRLQWRCRSISHIVCIESKNIYLERGGINNPLRQKDLWDHVGDRAVDAITAGGWLSSFTGEPLSKVEMDEYSVNAFLKLKDHLRPDMKVLEIGCSSGLTMFRVAPYVSRYCGTDLSSSILERTGREAKELRQDNIFLSCLPAHEIDNLDEGDFDLVIINSVVQCFDGHNYFRDVLAKVIGVMKEEGLLFLGDLMDEGRREELIKTLRKFKSSNLSSQEIKVKTDWSAELFIGKEFIHDLLAEDLGIIEAECSDKIFTIPNELTSFRYDALLRIDKKAGKTERIKKKFQHDLRDIVKYNEEAPRVEVRADNLCYVMYTSGSTGLPKGVLIEHRGVIRLVCDTSYVQLSSESRLLTTGAASFDATTFEFWGPLLNGGQLFLAPQATLLDPGNLGRYIRENRVNIMWFTAGWLNELIDHDIELFSPLTCILAGGDKLSYKHIRKLRKRYPDLIIINGYGPTENTTFSLCYPIGAEVYENIPVGRPITNSMAYILDAGGALAPIGVAGEIVLGGDGLARAYLNNESMTREKFIPDMFGSRQHLYRSGDIGRWLPDGNIEFLGRKDSQVKIRGFRIEPGEIESCLLSREYVDNAAVLVLQGSEVGIVAYVVLRNPQLDAATIALDLAETLPSYMIPNRFIILSALPLTDNGKVDRKKLASLDHREEEGEMGYQAAASGTEEALVEIWKEILGRDRIGVRDDFFASGGHSLRAISLLSAYHQKLGVKLKLKDIFEHPTIAEQAVLAEAAKHIGRADLLTALTPVTAGNQNMILIPAISGNSRQFKAFAESVQAVFNSYGLDYPGANLLEDPASSIDAMAAEFAEHLDRKGFGKAETLPILGYSMGGIIAFEVVKELERRGYSCQLIVVDRPAIMPGDIDRMKNFTQQEIDSYIRFLIGSFFGAAVREFNTDRMASYLLHQLRILDRQLTTGWITGDILSIEAVNTESPGKMVEWGGFTRGRHINYPIEADHYEMFQEKNISAMKELLYHHYSFLVDDAK